MKSLKFVCSILSLLLVTSLRAELPEPLFFATWDQDVSANQSPGAAVPNPSLGAITEQSVVGAGALDLKEIDSALTFSHVTLDGSSGTVAVWWRPAFGLSDNRNPKAILYWRNKFDRDKGEIVLRIADSRAPHDKLQFVIRGEGTEPQTLQTQVDLWTPGEWHWIAATWTGALGTFYVDGAEVVTLVLPDEYLALDVLTVGSIFGNQAAADFDNLQIWSDALTKQQIKKLYSEQSKSLK